jgi:hypothetical protein
MRNLDATTLHLVTRRVAAGESVTRRVSDERDALDRAYGADLRSAHHHLRQQLCDTPEITSQKRQAPGHRGEHYPTLPRHLELTTSEAPCTRRDAEPRARGHHPHCARWT